MTVNIAFTINVSTNKYFKKQKWSQLDHETQQRYLGNAIWGTHEYMKHSFQESDELKQNFQFVYEVTKAGHMHAHGQFRVEDYYANPAMNMFRWSIQQYLGLPRVPSEILCHLEPTVVDSLFWERYMNKEQKEEEPKAESDSDPELTPKLPENFNPFTKPKEKSKGKKKKRSVDTNPSIDDPK